LLIRWAFINSRFAIKTATVIRNNKRETTSSIVDAVVTRAACPNHARQCCLAVMFRVVEIWFLAWCLEKIFQDLQQGQRTKDLIQQKKR
jgi:hypothetical protein